MSDVSKRATLYRYVGNLRNELRNHALLNNLDVEIGPDRCLQRKDVDRAAAVKAQRKRIAGEIAKRRRS